MEVKLQNAAAQDGLDVFLSFGVRENAAGMNQQLKKVVDAMLGIGTTERSFGCRAVGCFRRGRPPTWCMIVVSLWRHDDHSMALGVGPTRRSHRRSAR
jgi:hypothetical protein